MQGLQGYSGVTQELQSSQGSTELQRVYTGSQDSWGCIGCTQVTRALHRGCRLERQGARCKVASCSWENVCSPHSPMNYYPCVIFPCVRSPKSKKKNSALCRYLFSFQCDFLLSFSSDNTMINMINMIIV